MKKGASGGGTIRLRSDGRWEARFQVEVNGVMKRKSLYRKTQKEARKAMTAALASAERGTYIEPTRITLGQWLDTWMLEYNPNVKDSTRVSYEGYIRTRIKPVLGGFALMGLKPAQIQGFYNGMISDGVAAKTVKNIHGVLHAALKQAVANGIIQTNPSEACKLKKAQRPEIRTLDRTQLSTLWNVLGNDVFSDVIRMAILTGMREGEILGLRWDCVDFDNGTITVARQLNKPRTAGSKYEFGTPKNGKTRTIAVADSAMAVLKQRKRKQAEERLAAGALWNEGEFEGLVFEMETGTHLNVFTLLRRFKAALDKAGLPDFRFHDLRHAFAVHSLQAGIDVKTVSESLGHSGIDITMNVYLHSLDEMKIEGAKKVESYFSELVGVKIGVK